MNFVKIENIYILIADCRNFPLRATLISTFLWIVNFIVGLFFGISTTEISPLNKAMPICFAAHFTILLRHPCVSAFSFRADAEGRKLDLKEDRERRRNLVIEEAKKDRELREKNAQEMIQIPCIQIELVHNV